jgi:hypothetical protein
MNNLVWHISTIFVFYFSLLMGVLTNFSEVRPADFFFLLMWPADSKITCMQPADQVEIETPGLFDKRDNLQMHFYKCHQLNKVFFCNYWNWQIPVGFSVVEVISVGVEVISDIVVVISVVVETK